ncbi:MAG: DUF1684 domain-containing protein [Chloroflexi bacterium]|nr:DUF1684 domain-containing protein [Chloroflexota bacterium]
MSELTEYRKTKDNFFKRHPQSPLSAEQKENFTGLNYFPENDALDFTLALERYTQPEHVPMQTSKGDVRDYLKVGQIRFPVHGQAVTLQVYEAEDNPGEYFLPFVDATAPEETYGAGRYLEPERVGANSLRVDFNLAYNPWCVYGDQWSCPIPPAENRLQVRIEAGEKNFQAHS